MVVIGDHVEIHGIRSQAAYNGLIGIVENFQGERFQVRVSGETKSFKEENLRVVPRDGRGREVMRTQARGAGDDDNPMKDLGKVMLTGAANVAKRNWKISSTWVLGLLLATFATGFTVSQADAEEYHRLMENVNTEALEQAEGQMRSVCNRYHNSRGFFSCSGACAEFRRQCEVAQQSVYTAEREVDAQISEAKKHVGIFSTYGVSEARQLFWKRFGQGKDFAKEQSFWSMLFMHRDEGLASFVFRVLLFFTIGVVSAAVTFLWSLWGVVSSYQAGSVQGLLFMGLAAIAVCAFIATWLIGLYLAGAGGLVCVGMTTRQLHLGEGQQRRRQHVRNY